jgi:hypothetical protein
MMMTHGALALVELDSDDTQEIRFTPTLTLVPSSDPYVVRHLDHESAALAALPEIRISIPWWSILLQTL